MQFFKKIVVWQPNSKNNIKDEISYLTISPVWPPTLENIDRYIKSMSLDTAESSQFEKLKNLHIKNFNKAKMSQAEKETYERYRNMFSISLFDKSTVTISMAEKDQEKIKNLKSLPVRFLHELGIVFKDLYWDDSTTPRELMGTFDDPVSSFIYMQTISQKMFFGNTDLKDIIAAIAELDTYRRTAVSDEVLEEFYPNLWENLKREEACCDEGVMRKCLN